MAQRASTVVVTLVVIFAGCSDTADRPPTAAELQADLASHNTDFVPSGDGFAIDSRPDLVEIARGWAGTAENPDWIYPGILTYPVTPGGDIEHSVWAVHYSDTEQIRLGPPGGTVVADVVVFLDATTLSELLTVMYSLPSDVG